MKYALTFCPNDDWDSVNTLIFETPYTYEEDGLPQDEKKVVRSVMAGEGYKDTEIARVIDFRRYFIRNCEDTDTTLNFDYE